MGQVQVQAPASTVLSGALTATVPTQFGINAGFHILTGMTINDVNQVMVFNVSSYINQNAYQTGLVPFFQGTFSTETANDYTTILAAPNFVQAIYSFLTQLIFFGGNR